MDIDFKKGIMAIYIAFLLTSLPYSKWLFAMLHALSSYSPVAVNKARLGCKLEYTG